MRLGVLAVAMAVGVGVGCPSAGTVRPPFRPLPDAFVDTLGAEILGELVAEIEQRMREAGFEIRVTSELDGYVETQWYDIRTKRSGGDQPAHPERLVRLRFWLDPLGPLGYQITSEAVHRLMTDPSLSERDLERMVPPGHQTERIVVEILDALKARFGG